MVAAAGDPAAHSTTPAHAEMPTQPMPSETGLRSSARMAAASATMPRSPGEGSASTMNSSPPMRAASASASRATVAIRSATATSSSSPASWPYRSLTALKPSRSR